MNWPILFTVSSPPSSSSSLLHATTTSIDVDSTQPSMLTTSYFRIHPSSESSSAYSAPGIASAYSMDFRSYPSSIQEFSSNCHNQLCATSKFRPMNTVTHYAGSEDIMTLSSRVGTELHTVESATGPVYQHNQHNSGAGLESEHQSRESPTLSALRSLEEIGGTNEADTPHIEACSTTPSTPFLDAQQYSMLMSDAANTVKAMAAEHQYPHASSPFPLSMPSMSNCPALSSVHALQTLDIPIHLQRQHQQHRHLDSAGEVRSYSALGAHHRGRLHVTAIRRTQSMDTFSACASSMSSPLLGSSASTTNSPLSTPLSSFRHPIHAHNIIGGYFPSSDSASMIQTSSDVGIHLNLDMDMGNNMLEAPNATVTMEDGHIIAPIPIHLSASDFAPYYNRPTTLPPCSSSFILSTLATPSSSPSSPPPSSPSPSAFAVLPLTPSSSHCRQPSNISTSVYPFRSPALEPRTLTSASTTTSSISKSLFLNAATTKLSSFSSPSSSSSRSNSNNSNKKLKSRYVCHVPNCHRTFSRLFNLKSHGLTHEVQRPHSCPQCPKTFARVHDRDRHMEGHLLEKAYSCIVCLGRFARQDAVTRHLKIANEENPCAIILKMRGISFREVAAGRVKRCLLGDESLIKKSLEELEEQARKQRASRNLQIGLALVNVKVDMDAHLSQLGGYDC